MYQFNLIDINDEYHYNMDLFKTLASTEPKEGQPGKLILSSSYLGIVQDYMKIFLRKDCKIDIDIFTASVKANTFFGAPTWPMNQVPSIYILLTMRIFKALKK